MKNIKNNYAKTIGLLSIVFITVLGCERDISDDAVPASFPSTSEVFLDGFSGGMQFQAFGDIFNFEVDNDVAYKGIASMRFAVPAEGETGSFAGGNFFTGAENADGSSFYAGGRDLSGFDALTFWAKSSMPAEIDEVGFGLNPDQGDVFRVSLKNLAVNTNWKKYYIPIPDASKVTAEQGLFYYFEGPEDGIGYTFWIDELQFEKLGTILQVESKIFEGNDASATGFNNVNIPVSGVSALYSLPDGSQQALDLTPSYFDYTASVPNIVSGDNLGSITPSGLGTTVLTASLNGEKSQGTFTVESLGDFKFAPIPTQDPADVISVFSNAYTNVSVDYFNGFWAPFQTTGSDDFSVDGDNILNYTEFNFVGTSLLGAPVDASGMAYLHFDIFIPGDLAGAQLGITVRDIGANGVDDGGDPDDIDVVGTFVTFTAGEWTGINIPLDASSKENIGLIIYDNLASTLTNFYVDNIYFHNDSSIVAGAAAPEDAAPTPTQNDADVISLFSDAFTDVNVDTWRTDWSSAAFEEVTIAGNATIKYSTLDFVGIETTSNMLDVSTETTLHMDVWSDDITSFSIKLVDFGPDGAFDGGDDAEHQIDFANPAQGEWVGYDIPLTDFTGLTTKAHIAQYILVGQPSGSTTIYIDNMYFY